MSINGKYDGVITDGNCVYTLENGCSKLNFGVSIQGEGSDARVVAAQDIAHAINCHDELVEALALSLDQMGGMSLDTFDELENVLNKAKGIEQ